MSLEEQKRYDELYKLKSYSGYETSQGIKYLPLVLGLVGKEVKTILDVGCGAGHSVRDFISMGYDCKGVETSEYLIENQLKDLVEKEAVQKMSATKLNFPPNSFDLVFCTDVMEHLPIQEVYGAIKEMSKVSKKYVFFTISYAPSDFEEGGRNLHITIRPRKWWVKTIEKEGNLKLVDPKFPWNQLINNKTLKFDFIKMKDYFLFEKR